MSKKKIVLADNSYTIRRIVELSFSEENEIELFTYENSLNLREKLLELRPAIVLVDIKLPDFSGYDVCRFVQESEGLNHTQVFLLKGGFEPIDESQLQGLKYVDIITKPFDSNALVANVKKLLEKIPESSATAPPQEVKAAPAPQPPAAPPVPEPPAPPAEDKFPSSLPEDFSEIGTLPEEDSEISFSDVKEEIDAQSDDLLSVDEFGEAPQAFADEEILPSEEITRAQPEKDTISPAAPAEDIEENPFVDELGGAEQIEDSQSDEELNIKRNIELQEKELEIGSLTVEEINIRKDIETLKRREADAQQEQAAAASVGDDTSEMFPGQSLEPTDDIFGERDADEIPEEPSGVPPVEPPAPEPGEMDAEDELFAFAEEKTQPPAFDQEDEKLFAPEPEIPDIKYETHPGEADVMELGLEAEVPPTEEMKMPEMEPTEPEPLVEDREMDSLQFEEEQPSFAEETPQFPEVDEPVFQEPMESETSGMDDFPTEEPPAAPPVVEPQPEVTQPEPMDDVQPKDEWTGRIETESWDEPEQLEEPVTESVPEEVAPLTVEETVPQSEPAPIAEPDEPVDSSRTAESTGTVPPVTDISQELVLQRVEEKLTGAIKEMLWEIIPPLAEKIIKQEIESIKADLADSLK
jgi:CheY-like chemotaxis protein